MAAGRQRVHRAEAMEVGPAGRADAGSLRDARPSGERLDARSFVEGEDRKVCVHASSFIYTYSPVICLLLDWYIVCSVQKLNSGMDCECCCCEKPIRKQEKNLLQFPRTSVYGNVDGTF